MTCVYNTAAGGNRLAVSLLAGSVTPAAGQSVDSGSGNGLLVIGTSTLSGGVGILATITLAKPSFSITSKVATLLGIPLSTTATANGVAAKAELRDSASNTIIAGLTVGLSGTDIIVNSTTISSGQTVTVTAGNIATT